MWLSRRMVQQRGETEAATLGTVSIGGGNTTVVTDAERRGAQIISPGGYCWQPGTNQSVLVLKANETYIPGAVQTAQQTLAPGEVMIYSERAQVVLRNNGDVELRGKVRVTGQLFLNGEEVLAR